MAWTQSDVDALESAIKRGVRTVSFQDRSVTYSSMDEMLKLRGIMKDEVASTSGSLTARSSYATFSKE